MVVRWRFGGGITGHDNYFGIFVPIYYGRLESVRVRFSAGFFITSTL